MNTERFREIREKRGLSKRKLSQLTGIAEMQLVRYETGANDPSTEKLKLLASVLGVTSDYLLGVSDNPLGDFSENVLTTDEQELLTAYPREGWKGVFRLGAERMPG
jgi:transcriptional regulator with XRE-family HTH domain